MGANELLLTAVRLCVVVDRARVQQVGRFNDTGASAESEEGREYR